MNSHQQQYGQSFPSTSSQQPQLANIAVLNSNGGNNLKGSSNMMQGNRGTNSQLQCTLDGHCFDRVEWICVLADCKAPTRVCCNFCIHQNHVQHQQHLLPLEEFQASLLERVHAIDRDKNLALHSNPSHFVREDFRDYGCFVNQRQRVASEFQEVRAHLQKALASVHAQLSQNIADMVSSLNEANLAKAVEDTQHEIDRLCTADPLTTQFPHGLAYRIHTGNVTYHDILERNYAAQATRESDYAFGFFELLVDRIQSFQRTLSDSLPLILSLKSPAAVTNGSLSPSRSATTDQSASTTTTALTPATANVVTPIQINMMQHPIIDTQQSTQSSTTSNISAYPKQTYSQNYPLPLTPLSQQQQQHQQQPLYHQQQLQQYKQQPISYKQPIQALPPLQVQSTNQQSQQQQYISPLRGSQALRNIVNRQEIVPNIQGAAASATVPGVPSAMSSTARHSYFPSQNQQQQQQQQLPIPWQSNNYSNRSSNLPSSTLSMQQKIHPPIDSSSVTFQAQQKYFSAVPQNMNISDRNRHNRTSYEGHGGINMNELSNNNNNNNFGEYSNENGDGNNRSVTPIEQVNVNHLRNSTPYRLGESSTRAVEDNRHLSFLNLSNRIDPSLNSNNISNSVSRPLIRKRVLSTSFQQPSSQSQSQSQQYSMQSQKNNFDNHHFSHNQNKNEGNNDENQESYPRRLRTSGGRSNSTNRRSIGVTGSNNGGLVYSNGQSGMNRHNGGGLFDSPNRKSLMHLKTAPDNPSDYSVQNHRNREIISACNRFSHSISRGNLALEKGFPPGAGRSAAFEAEENRIRAKDMGINEQGDSPMCSNKMASCYSPERKKDELNPFQDGKEAAAAAAVSVPAPEEEEFDLVQDVIVDSRKNEDELLEEFNEKIPEVSSQPIQPRPLEANKDRIKLNQPTKGWTSVPKQNFNELPQISDFQANVNKTNGYIALPYLYEGQSKLGMYKASTNPKLFYEGEWLKGLRHGQGTCSLDDGSIYEGQWRDDQFSGTGRLAKPSGEVYQGEFLNGKFNGTGRISLPDKSVYIGEWKDGLYEGRGRKSWDTGSYYEGQFSKGIREGDGIFKWKNGSFYKGQFSANQFNGQGQYKWANGRTYVGGWKDGKMEGQARDVSEQGYVYEGMFKNDRKSGFGVFHYSRQKRFEGNWEDDKPHGQGCIIENGVKQPGVWDKGVLISS